MKTKTSDYKSPSCSPLEVCNECVLCLSDLNNNVDSSNEDFGNLKDFEW